MSSPDRMIAAEAADPSTPAARLGEIADLFPECHEALVLNPSCPPEVRQWVVRHTPAAELAWRAHLRQAVQSPPPSQPVAPRGSAPAPGPTPARRSSGYIGLSLVLVVVSVFFWGWLLANGREGPDAAQGTESVDGETQIVLSTVGPTGKASAAPEDAISAGLIQSPSLNISCEIYDDRISCSILDRHYGWQDCPDRLFSVTVEEEPYKDCGQEFLGEVGDPVTTLDYGESVANEHFACTSRQSGMTCWNQHNGNGFTISRDTYKTF